MNRLYDEQTLIERESKCLGLSVVLHLFILAIMCFNFSWNTSEFEKSPPAILMVDLTKVKIDEKTNLPPLVKETKKEEVKAPEVKKEEKKPEPKKEDKTPLVKKEAPVPKPEPVKPIEQPKKEAVKVQEKKPEPKKEVKKKEPKKEPKKEVKKEKPKPKPKPKEKPKVAPKPVPKKQNQGLQSLLASVEKVRKPANSAPASTPSASGQTVNKGIKGGTEGSLLSDLTISEKDLIASKISSCWNVNAGVENADQMIVEIRAFINKDGSVREVKILNMKADPVFRSMAESAKRAIYVCDALKEDSPFRILANKRPEMYSSWKEIYLRMNPIDKGVY